MNFIKKKKIAKKTYRSLLIALLIIIPSFIGIGYFYWDSKRNSPRIEMIEMRDGIILATDIYLPKGEGPFPALIYRTPYGKTEKREHVEFGFLDYGIAIIVQDHRGCFDSEGEYTAFASDGRDANDTIKWMNEQEWFNGIYATIGGSALGITQYMQVGHLYDVQCQYIEVATPYLYGQAMTQGGAPRRMLASNWLRGIGHEDYYVKIFEDPFINSTFAKEHQVDENDWITITWPSIHKGGYFDCFAQGIIDGYTGYQHNGGIGGKDNARLIMGPWTHDTRSNIQGELIFPENAKSCPTFTKLFNSMFAEGLFGSSQNDFRNMPNVTYYVMGDVNETSTEWNRWATGEDWPLDHEIQKYYIQSDNTLNKTKEIFSSEKSYLFNPKDPVTTHGGANLNGKNCGPLDQNEVESGRSDVLQYDFKIDEPLLVSGRISVTLYVSSNCTDTDFTAKLMDVYPTGESYILNDGIFRMRYRNGRDHYAFMDGTGKTVYQIDIDLWSTSYVFNVGHTLRLSISSSNYPRFDINPNIDQKIEPTTELTESYIANNTILLGEEYPSSINLPIPIESPSFF